VAELPQVHVVSGSALAFDFGAADGIYANAGLTAPPVAWLERLRSGGRMILPLTEMVSETAKERSGAVLWLKRISDDYQARFLSAESDHRMYPCQDGRSADAEDQLVRAFARGGHLEVRSLRTAPHAEEATCWLHGSGFCLSRLAPCGGPTS
jgi:protein-L-isoaspartate(D-aspartate) O-methyltransferase